MLALADGGFFRGAWPLGIIGFLGAAVLVCLRSGRPSVGRPTWLFVAGIGTLATWTAVTSPWSLDPRVSLWESVRTLLYAAAIVAFAAAQKGLVRGIVAGATFVSAWGLLDRLVHGAQRDPFEGTLLFQPLGYANALGALAAMGAVACLVQALRGRRTSWASAAPVPLLAIALVLTDSRGAWAAAAAGLAFGVPLARGRVRLAAAVAGVCTVLVAVLLAFPLPGLGQRAAYWDAARASAHRHLVVGIGAGSYGTMYAANGPRAAPPAQDAHSLYLETLDELGVVGLVGLLVTLSLPLVVGLRSSPPPAAALAVYLVFVLHAGIDWDWEMPAVTVAGLAAGVAALLDRPRSTRVRPQTQIVLPPLAHELAGATPAALWPRRRGVAP